jgi:hypothetical protein
MKGTIALLIFIIGALEASSQAYQLLDINNVSARFNSNGLLFQDLSTSNPGFEVPKGSGIHSIFSGTLWVGGQNPNNQLHLAAGRYGQGSDYQPGPIMDVAQYASQVPLWDRLWKVNKTEVDYHIANWSNTSYVMPQVFIDWPAHGNIALGQDFYLAPFFDYDGDGIYDPYSGDYPQIKGDQAVYFIFNDELLHTESGGELLRIQIKAMAYAYNCTLDTALMNTVFLQYEITNHSTQTFTETRLGVWTDMDLGNYSDDYIGSDVARGSYYCYNGDAIDDNGYLANLGAQSVTFLAGPYQDADTIDNPFTTNVNNAIAQNGIPYAFAGQNYGDQTIDNERMGMRKFLTHLPTSGPQAAPSTAVDYYNYLQGKWLDGTPLMHGGTGHQSSIGTVECSFMFPGDTDPLYWSTNSDTVSIWSEQTSGNPPGDRRGVGSTGPFTFLPGATQTLDLAFVFARDYTGSGPAASITALQNSIDDIHTMFKADSVPASCGTVFSLGVSEANETDLQVSVYPNPATSIIRIEHNLSTNIAYSLFDIIGNKVKSGAVLSQQAVLDISALANGMYVLKIQSGDQIYTAKLIKE